MEKPIKSKQKNYKKYGKTCKKYGKPIKRMGSLAAITWIHRSENENRISNQSQEGDHAKEGLAVPKLRKNDL